jgi:hypothetical protein
MTTDAGPAGPATMAPGSSAGGPGQDAPGAWLVDRKLPPVAQVAVVSMALVIVGGIYLASYLPRHAPLGPAIGLLAASGVLIVFNLWQLSRLEDFAWHTFRLVGKWALAAYAVIAGMLEYIFAYDGTRGALLAVLTLMLVAFAVNVPLVISFTVARYQEPLHRTAES